MNLEFWTISLLSAGLALFYVFFPWIEEQESRASSETQKFLDEYQTHFQEREIALESLKDLELDFRTGKIQASDYEELRSNLLHQAVQKNLALESMEKSHPIFEWINHQLKER